MKIEKAICGPRRVVFMATFARKNLDTLWARKPIGVETELRRERGIETHQLRSGNGSGCHSSKETVRQSRIGMIEWELKGHDSSGAQ